VVLPAAGSATIGIGLGLGRWAAAVAVEPRNPNHCPHPPIYSTARRGPTSHVIGLGVPDQDARSGPRHGRWAKSGGDQNQHSPP
jgi:hypothetical protein